MALSRRVPLGAWYWSGSQIAPCHTCGDKEIRNSPEKGPIAEPYLATGWDCESYANGRIDVRPDFSNNTGLDAFSAVENVRIVNGGLEPVDASQPAQVTVLLQSPYNMTQAGGSGDGVAQCEVSIDGKTWKPAKLADFGASVGGQVRAFVRLTIQNRLTGLHLSATVQNNPFALPYLSPGRNKISVSVADRVALGDNRLVVTYAYRIGARRKSYEQLCLEGKEIARGHDASWEETPTVVQKTFSAADLPATFEIDIPTPQGQYPVYPRMVFVRREVIGANQQPLPVPARAQAPRRTPGDELKTLPNPLLAGTQLPPPGPKHPVSTRTIPLPKTSIVSRSGEVNSTDLLKWPKNSKEDVPAIALLVGGELGELPALKNLAAARLVITATRAHQKAPTKIGACPLKTPFSPGKPYDFANIGDVQGTAVLPVLAEDAPAWSPPKEIRIDVTRYVKAVLLGEAKFHGFAVRVIPDRGVDDGWTVRVQIPKELKAALELEIYNE